MKYEKFIDDLDNRFERAEVEQKKRQKKLNYFLKRFEKEEQKILSKMEEADNKDNRKKLKKKLDMVHKAYALLGHA
jgi:hypothetical protein